MIKKLKEIAVLFSIVIITIVLVINGISVNKLIGNINSSIESKDNIQTEMYLESKKISSLMAEIASSLTLVWLSTEAILPEEVASKLVNDSIDRMSTNNSVIKEIGPYIKKGLKIN
jgi:hypothetical protein